MIPDLSLCGYHYSPEPAHFWPYESQSQAVCKTFHSRLRQCDHVVLYLEYFLFPESQDLASQS